MIDQAVHPVNSGRTGDEPRVDSAVRLHQFGRVHGRVADNEQLPALVEATDQVTGRNCRRTVHRRTLENGVVDTVVEVIRPKILQPVLLVERRQQRAYRLEIRIHGAADIHQEEQTHVVAPRRSEHQLDLTRVPTGFVDGLVDIELAGSAVAGHAAQFLERDLDLTDVERLVCSVVFEVTLLGDLHRRTIA